MKYLLTLTLIAGLITHPEKVFCSPTLKVCTQGYCATTYQCPFTQYITVEN